MLIFCGFFISSDRVASQEGGSVDQIGAAIMTGKFLPGIVEL